MGRRAKVMACGGMTTGFLLFLVTLHPPVIAVVAVALVMSGSAIYICTRPTTVR